MNTYIHPDLKQQYSSDLKKYNEQLEKKALAPPVMIEDIHARTMTISQMINDLSSYRQIYDGWMNLRQVAKANEAKSMMTSSDRQYQ